MILSDASPVIVTFALEAEAAPFRRAARRLPHVKIILTGMGRQRAERAIRDVLAGTRPALVISAGFAGALHPELRAGEVMFAGAEEGPLPAAVLRTGARRGSFHCAAEVVLSARQKKELWLATGADAVEMESRWIGEACRAAGVACLTVRAISDEAGEDLPLDFNRLATAEGGVSVPGVLAALGRAPGKLPALLRLQRRAALAARRLAGVLAAALGEWTLGAAKST